MLKLPLIVVNCKAYENCVGEGAVRIAKVCERVARLTQTSIAVAVETPDIYHVRMAVQIPVFAQHVDSESPGAHTGVVLPESVRDAGAVGTLLNHSEKRLAPAVLSKSVERAKKAGLLTIVCAANPGEAKRIAGLKPDLIAIEPPELIGGSVSVSTARPEVVTETTRAIKDVPVLCGAGIKTKEDVAKAMKLGVKGILVASGVTLARNPEQVLRDFALAMK
ncbi:MAG: triose-phosphate isomerase [Candidatus Woesearchaeota archaeon]